MELPPLASMLSVQSIRIGASAQSIPDIIDEITDLLVGGAAGPVNRTQVREALIAREATQSTGVGYSCAMPHAAVPGLEKVVGCIVICDPGVAFGALDGKPVKIFFGFLIPSSMVAERAWLARKVFDLLMREAFRNRLLAAKTKEDILKAVQDEAEA